MPEILTKRCSKCRLDKPLNEFYPQKGHKDGLRSACKNCTSKEALIRTNKSRDQNAQVLFSGNTIPCPTHKICCDCKLDLPSQDFNKNIIAKDGLQTYCRKCSSIKSKKDISNATARARKNKNNKTRRLTDIGYRLSINLRRRILHVIKDGCKAGSAVRDLGCPVKNLKAYLESLFWPGMTWKNLKKDGWHVDHIIPLARFDLTNRGQFLIACHYTNLQPLWADDNNKKKMRLDWTPAESVHELPERLRTRTP